MVSDPRCKVYNKLVRDHMPDIIKTDGLIPVWKKLTGRELVLALAEKLVEEAIEVRDAVVRQDQSGAFEEFGDLLTVARTLALRVDIPSMVAIQQASEHKTRSMGGFSGGVFLIEVKEGPVTNAFYMHT